jgi:hypothetical protein
MNFSNILSWGETWRGVVVKVNLSTTRKFENVKCVAAAVREHRTGISDRIYHAAEAFFWSLGVSGCSFRMTGGLRDDLFPKAPENKCRKGRKCRPAPEVDDPFEVVRRWRRFVKKAEVGGGDSKGCKLTLTREEESR